jgi:hypothetical protein
VPSYDLDLVLLVNHPGTTWDVARKASIADVQELLVSEGWGAIPTKPFK